MKRFFEKLILAIACGASMGTVLLIGLRWATTSASAQGNIPAVIRAKKFELISPTGKVIASLSTTKSSQVELAMNNKLGENRISLGIDNNGMSSLNLNSADLSFSYIGTTSMGCTSSHGSASLSVNNLNLYGYGIGFTDITPQSIAMGKYAGADNQVNYVQIGRIADKDGSCIVIRDSDDNERVSIGSTTTEQYEGEKRVVTTTPPNAITLFDKDGKVTWQTPTN